jgi:hypothetical protein
MHAARNAIVCAAVCAVAAWPQACAVTGRGAATD